MHTLFKKKNREKDASKCLFRECLKITFIHEINSLWRAFPSIDCKPFCFCNSATEVLEKINYLLHGRISHNHWPDAPRSRFFFSYDEDDISIFLLRLFAPLSTRNIDLLYGCILCHNFCNLLLSILFTEVSATVDKYKYLKKYSPVSDLE